MDAAKRRRWSRARNLNLRQLRAQDPGLADELGVLFARHQAAAMLAHLDAPEPVRARVAQIDVERIDGDVVEHVRARLIELGIPERTVERAARRSESQATPHAEEPLSGNLVAARQIAQADVHEAAALAGLPSTAATALTKTAESLAALDEPTLAKMVDEKHFTDSQARAVGFASTLYQIVDHDADLAAAIREGSAATLDGQPATSTADLARLNATEWIHLLSSTKAPLPAGATAESVGRALAARLAALHPGAAAVAHLPRVVVRQLGHDVNSLGPLFERNSHVVGVDFAQLDTSGLTPAEVESLRNTHTRLVQLARAYPGLQIAAALDDSSSSAEARARTVARRVAYVSKVIGEVGEPQIMELDLSFDSRELSRLGLDSLDATPAEQAMILATFKTYQRVFAVARNLDDAHTLVGQGYTSALSIARRHLASFAESSSLDSPRAKEVWESARRRLAGLGNTVGAILDAIHGGFSNLATSNQPATAATYLKSLPGYEDLFGTLAFCDCEECESILGPAAYFVDLMKFIDENLRDQFASRPSDPLDLQVRRPDLWTLELSCDNTNDRVPTLELVDEILENYIAIHELGYAGPPSDRTAIRTLVYKTALSALADSFNQPFHLPLTRIRSYLSELGNTAAEIAAALSAPTTTLTQAELGLSALELQKIISPDPDLTHLAHVYGVAFTGTPAAVDNVDAQLLGSAVYLSRSELGDLVATAFVAAGGATVAIVATKRSPDSVQNDIELVEGLTADALDRMHRFIRLRRKSGWTIADLDLVLSTVGNTTLAGIDDVAQLHAVQARFSMTVPQVCALAGALPQTPAGGSLFDRTFNSPSYVAADGPFPKPKTHFIHPAFRQSTPAPVDPSLSRLLTGLAVDLDALAGLARHLAKHLAQETATSFDPNAPADDDRYFVLSAENLALLYRHAQLARMLRLSVEDLFELLGFAGLDHVASIGDALTLIDLADWQRSSGYRIDDVAVATGQTPRNAARYADPGTVALQVQTSAENALVFSDTMFAVVLGTTEKGSRDLIAANPTVIESPAEGKWRLAAGIDLDTVAIAIPTSVTVPTPPSGTRPVTDAEVRAALRPYLAAEVLVRTLGGALKLATDKVIALAGLGGQSLTADALVKAVRGDGPLAPLTTLVGYLSPLAVVFAAEVWQATDIDFAQKNPALFGDHPLPQTSADALHPRVPFVDLLQLRALSTYTRLAQRHTGTAPNTKPVDPTDIQIVLSQFRPPQPPPPAVPTTPASFPSSSDTAMASVLNVPSGLVVGLRGRVPLPAIAAHALDRLDRAAQLATQIGLDGETFGGIVSDDYDTLSHAADSLVAVLGARFTDEVTREARLDEAEQPVREAKRDALADYLIHSITPRVWGSLNELYEYFLIDVEAGGCATTSRVVAATMSAQLYVHRALLNLEQNGLPPSDPAYFVLRLPADAAAEWDWRKNFRVWQANREVFLWPENYLDPDLRDDKTPLFKQLEQELLQTDISDLQVLDAYTKYLAQFEEVASLTIAGAYHEARWTAHEKLDDVLHLFGVSSTEPPTYYYRTCENLVASGRYRDTGRVWSPWQKVNIQIGARRVAPVVSNGRLQVFWMEVRTRPFNQVHDGESDFVGYRHNMALKFTTLRPDGTWTAPQQVQLPDVIPGAWNFGPSRGQVTDTLHNHVPNYDVTKAAHNEPVDDYTLSGPSWDGIWPVPWGWTKPSISIFYRNFLQRDEIDLFARKTYNVGASPVGTPGPTQLLAAREGNPTKPLYCGTPGTLPWHLNNLANLVIDEKRIDAFALDLPLTAAALKAPLYKTQIATIPDETALLAVPGGAEEGLLQMGPDLLLLEPYYLNDGNYFLERIGTTLVAEVARQLFENGLDSLLDIKTQLALGEAGLPLTLVGTKVSDHSNTGKLDFTGAYGTYYRELFFHIPFLIANALNSRGRFEASQRWYNFIFDPTASETIDVSGLPPDEAAHRLLDRVWRYREFRGLDIPKLRDILTDPAAIAIYKKDPFNPWAIARQRISAFQKAIVMKYVDNLLDWADSLFTQFTMESVNEALMLYIMVSDILGPRPPEIGDCGSGVDPMTYETIGPLVTGDHEIFPELETWSFGRASSNPPAGSSQPKYTLPLFAVANALRAASFSEPVQAAKTGAVAEPPFRGFGWNTTRTASWGPALGNATVKSHDAAGGRSFDHAWKGGEESWIGRFSWTIARQTPVFCIPVNADLLGYWDRVEDRLFKIRHCEDIDGNKRELALFAPPINPMQLVAMKAAGLSLEDVLGSTSGSLPPYRFLYLIDRAKAFTASLSGFGAALLSALEKRDGEEMNRLRLTQQMNLAQLTTHIRQLEIDNASQALEALNQQLAAAQYRSDFYSGLISTDRNDWEGAQSVAQHLSTGVLAVQGVLELLGGVTHLIPQIGSPFAMKFGGAELGSSFGKFADATNVLSAISQAVAASAGLEANFARRTEGWQHQKKLADLDIKSLNRNIQAASIRLDIANRSYDLHQTSIDQIQQMLDLMDGKFTSLGLYVFLSTQLQRLYRGAFQNALAVAKLAEQAFRFERGDDTQPGLAMSYWDPTHAGLLAGEQLLIDLQTLERRYLETNYRTLEVDQAFAVSQVDASALIDLRETGECLFAIPEVYFDLFYPGHYKRRIKAVRLTIPCITGPYVNVSASLNLDKSWIRPTPAAGAQLVEVPPSRSVSIATSTAQNDAGVFELSFRDERYMPFEGLGAVSQWRLTLPKTFRPFDYQTINDVLLSISYTAEQDGVLRDRVESELATVEGSILGYFSNNVARRVFSMRQDFSAAFARLLRSPPGTAVKIELTDRNFPVFAQGRTIQVTRGVVLLKTAGDPPTGFELSVDGAAVKVFAADPSLGNLPGQSLPAAFTSNLRASHTLSVTATGGLGTGAPPPGQPAGLDPSKLIDVLLYVEYQLA